MGEQSQLPGDSGSRPSGEARCCRVHSRSTASRISWISTWIPRRRTQTASAHASGRNSTKLIENPLLRLQVNTQVSVRFLAPGLLAPLPFTAPGIDQATTENRRSLVEQRRPAGIQRSPGPDELEIGGTPQDISPEAPRRSLNRMPTGAGRLRIPPLLRCALAPERPRIRRRLSLSPTVPAGASRRCGSPVVLVEDVVDAFADVFCERQRPGHRLAPAPREALFGVGSRGTAGALESSSLAEWPPCACFGRYRRYPWPASRGAGQERRTRRSDPAGVVSRPCRSQKHPYGLPARMPARGPTGPIEPGTLPEPFQGGSPLACLLCC